MAHSNILLRSLGFAALTALVAASAHAMPAPRMAAKSFEQLAQPLPLPYDENAKAGAAIAAAKARAKASGKLLLIDLGGNWCPDCRILAGTLQLPELATFVAQHYEVVMVDIGRYDRNMDVPAHYGLGRPEGVPSLLIVDPTTDRLINKGRTTALADARSMTPQALADWIAHWVPSHKPR
jgi:thiol-disulfide isomerase/thioredoxin